MNRTATTTATDRQKPRVLVVEDEGDIRDLIRFHLEKEGFVVETANTGDRGLDLALSRSYDVALLDLMLPGMDGYEICRRAQDRQPASGCLVQRVVRSGALRRLQRQFVDLAIEFRQRRLRTEALCVAAALRRAQR
ncbi:MAG: response regulator [Planctomycetes bacterium]|nr:response regulator [Planctomycetota bacterium]